MTSNLLTNDQEYVVKLQNPNYKQNTSENTNDKLEINFAQNLYNFYINFLPSAQTALDVTLSAGIAYLTYSPIPTATYIYNTIFTESALTPNILTKNAAYAYTSILNTPTYDLFTTFSSLYVVTSNPVVLLTTAGYFNNYYTEEHNYHFVKTALGFSTNIALIHSVATFTTNIIGGGFLIYNYWAIKNNSLYEITSKAINWENILKLMFLTYQYSKITSFDKASYATCTNIIEIAYKTKEEKIKGFILKSIPSVMFVKDFMIDWINNKVDGNVEKLFTNHKEFYKFIGEKFFPYLVENSLEAVKCCSLNSDFPPPDNGIEAIIKIEFKNIINSLLDAYKSNNLQPTVNTIIAMTSAAYIFYESTKFIYNNIIKTSDKETSQEKIVEQSRDISPAEEDEVYAKQPAFESSETTIVGLDNSSL